MCQFCLLEMTLATGAGDRQYTQRLRLRNRWGSYNRWRKRGGGGAGRGCCWPVLHCSPWSCYMEGEVVAPPSRNSHSCSRPATPTQPPLICGDEQRGYDRSRISARRRKLLPHLPKTVTEMHAADDRSRRPCLAKRPPSLRLANTFNVSSTPRPAGSSCSVSVCDIVGRTAAWTRATRRTRRLETVHRRTLQGTVFASQVVPPQRGTSGQFKSLSGFRWASGNSTPFRVRGQPRGWAPQGL